MIIYGFYVLIFLVQFLSKIYLLSFAYFVNDCEINSNIEHMIIFIFSHIIYIISQKNLAIISSAEDMNHLRKRKFQFPSKKDNQKAS